MGQLKKIKEGSNMYQGWVTHTWAPITGCPYGCLYCYTRKYGLYKDSPTIDKTFPSLGKGKTIFVGHMGDMFADEVPDGWIISVLDHCQKYPNNKYVFQSKNPYRMRELSHHFPRPAIVGTTVETDNDEILGKISKAPQPHKRMIAIFSMKGLFHQRFITIEPVIDFASPRLFASKILAAEPTFVNIGADSKNHGLSEPTANKLEALLMLLTGRVEIRQKTNLKRILGE